MLNEDGILILKAGDAAVLRGDIKHAVNPNISSNNRMSMLLNFYPFYIKTMTTSQTIAGNNVNMFELPPFLQELLGLNFRDVLKQELAKI